MWVIFTHDVTDDTSGFYRGMRGFPTVFVHGIEDSTVYRFEAVADIRESAVNNHGHGIAKEVIFHGVFDGLVLNTVLFNDFFIIFHISSLKVQIIKVNSFSAGLDEVLAEFDLISH